MQTTVLTKTGKKSKNKITLDKSVFGVEINQTLIRQALHVHQNNQRQRTAHTKTRSEKRGGGAKPWRQKGTGRARAGSSRSPIWRGGGVAFGPRNEGDSSKKLSKKMRKSAIKSVFSFLASENRIVILPDPVFKKDRLTKQFHTILFNSGYEGKILVLHAGNDNKLYFGGRNIPGVGVTTTNEVSIHDLLSASWVIILDSALEDISQKWGNGKAKTKTATAKSTAKKS